MLSVAAAQALNIEGLKSAYLGHLLAAGRNWQQTVAVR